MQRYIRITEDAFGSSFGFNSSGYVPPMGNDNPLVGPEVTFDAGNNNAIFNCDIFEIPSKRKLDEFQMSGSELSDETSIKEFLMQHGYIKGQMREVSIIFKGKTILILDANNDAQLYKIKINGNYEGPGEKNNQESPDLLSSAVYTQAPSNIGAGSSAGEHSDYRRSSGVR